MRGGRPLVASPGDAPRRRDAARITCPEGQQSHPTTSPRALDDPIKHRLRRQNADLLCKHGPVRPLRCPRAGDLLQPDTLPRRRPLPWSGHPADGKRAVTPSHNAPSILRARPRARGPASARPAPRRRAAARSRHLHDPPRHNRHIRGPTSSLSGPRWVRLSVYRQIPSFSNVDEGQESEGVAASLAGPAASKTAAGPRALFELRPPRFPGRRIQVRAPGRTHLGPCHSARDP
jgi:hypothetical protein